jgi:transcriptional regulator NrdR family protein
MPDEPINYTKEAFLSPWNLVFLIMAMVTAFVLTGTGVANFVLLFAAALELLYLGIMPRQERFRRVVRSRKMAERNKPPSEKEVFRQLTKSSQKRYIRFRNIEKAVRENYQKLSYASQGMLESHLKKIDDLLDSYLNMLQQKERYERFAQQATEDEVVEAMARLREEMTDDPPKVQQIKQKRLNILEKRLAKFKKAHENLAVIEAQLETIEDVTKYIHEQSLTMRNPEEISFQLDTLVSEVEETQASIGEIEEVFARPTDLLDDLDTFEDPTTTGSTATRDRLQN